MDGKQIHLTGKTGYSWRAVRLRNLDSDEVDDAASSASKEAGEDRLMFNRLLLKGYLTRACQSVSPPVGEREAEDARKAAVEPMRTEAEAAVKLLKGKEQQEALASWTIKIQEAGEAAWAQAAEKALLALPGSQWSPVTGLEMMIKGGPKSLGRLFTPKDMDVLRGYLNAQYNARADEADAIMGKARPISMD